MHENKKGKLTVRVEDLAVPEIHTGRAPVPEELPPEETEIQYDTVAIPEIRLRRPPRE